MENVKVSVKGKILTVEVDLSKDIGPSKSGKTMVIASTKGNPEVAPGVCMGLNVYKPRK